jgi:glutamate synthase (NADPH/NADH) small chain
MATSRDDMEKLTFRKFEDGDYVWDDLHAQIFEGDHSHKCPVYVHRTPPCQGSCPSGEDIRGWLQIVRGIEKPPQDVSWQEYAFRRSTDANPFPSMMGRVCPAPCEDGCNRNEVEDFVGINAIEQYIGDTAKAEGFKFAEGAPLTGKKAADRPAGPPPTSCAAWVMPPRSSMTTRNWVACSSTGFPATAPHANFWITRFSGFLTWVTSRSS